MGVTTSQIDPQYKMMLQQTLQNNGISANSAEGQKLLAMGFVEGDLGPDAQDTSKSGGSANLTGFNINQGMVSSLNLPTSVTEGLQSSDYATQMDSAIKCMDAEYKKDGTGDELEHWVRGGSATAEEGFQPYDQEVKDNIAAIQADPTIWTDSNRFSEDVAHQ